MDHCESRPEILKYMIPKGSVSLDGISLTVVHTEEGMFDVSLIPHTMGVTTLRDKKPGDMLNIECDLVAKYIENSRGTRAQQAGSARNFLINTDSETRKLNYI